MTGFTELIDPPTAIALIGLYLWPGVRMVEREKDEETK